MSNYNGNGQEKDLEVSSMSQGAGAGTWGWTSAGTATAGGLALAGDGGAHLCWLVGRQCSSNLLPGGRSGGPQAGCWWQARVSSIEPGQCTVGPNWAGNSVVPATMAGGGSALGVAGLEWGRLSWSWALWDCSTG